MITIVDRKTGKRHTIILRRWNREGTEYNDTFFEETYDPSLAMDNVGRILGERGQYPILKKRTINPKYYHDREHNYSVRIEPKKKVVKADANDTG